MEEKADELYAYLKVFFASMLAFISPIQLNILAMTMLFTLNFMFGFAAAIRTGEGWNKKKVYHFFIEALAFFALILFMYGVGSFQGNPQETRYAVIMFCWVACWFYGTNIARNGAVAFKGSTLGRLFAFLYWVLSMKMVSKIPYLKEYLKQEYNN